jgi:hypothetical protein
VFRVVKSLDRRAVLFRPDSVSIAFTRLDLAAGCDDTDSSQREALASGEPCQPGLALRNAQSLAAGSSDQRLSLQRSARTARPSKYGA